MHITDPAGNVITSEIPVTAEQDPLTMTAFMMGRTYTSAHNPEPGQTPDWTMILSAKASDLAEGVTIPILAGHWI